MAQGLTVGELRLMAAVLEDAVNILRKRPRSRAGREAREWLQSKDANWPFAFERICDALDLDADGVRRQVARNTNVSRVPVRTFEALGIAESAERFAPLRLSRAKFGARPASIARSISPHSPNCAIVLSTPGG